MEGLGFLIWRLVNILPVERTIEKLIALGVRWVSIKVLDGTAAYNYYNEAGRWTGNPDFLLRVIQLFREAGIEVGGWQFVYTYKMKEQAQAAVQAVSTFRLAHWLIDAEEVPEVGAFWQTDPNAGNKARQYLDNLKVSVPVALCSYRFPTLHRPFPFSVFLRHPTNTFVAPQMYWMNANNPGAQLERTKQEYDAICSLPMIPIGAAFSEHGWSPKPGEIAQFIAKAKDLGMTAWGFWNLDEALQHDEWLFEMQDCTAPKPNPLPPEPATGTYRIYYVKADSLNVRDNIIPSIKYGRTIGRVYMPSKVWFTLPRGAKVEALEELQDGRNSWVRIGQRQYVAKIYDDVEFLE